MFNIDSNIQQIILIHILICGFFYNYKPSFMFDENNNFKPFGTGPLKTIFPFWLVTTAFSLIVYLFIVVKKDEFV